MVIYLKVYYVYVFVIVIVIQFHPSAQFEMQIGNKSNSSIVVI